MLQTRQNESAERAIATRVPSGMNAAVTEMSRLGQLPYDPHEITRPVLVIQGEWDAVAPPAAGMWLYSRLGSALNDSS
jgi:pimeloyl-ACP methyl ester carboxylesterase